MAEHSFQEVMKQWRRMCKNCAETQGSCVDAKCPIVGNPTCGELSDASDQEIAEAEKAIMQWAAEHPEPVYPTWVEYLVGIGVIPNEIRLETADALMDTHLLKPIPADISEKLGLEPKEGT